MPKSSNKRKSTTAQRKKSNRAKHHQSHLKGPLARLAKAEREARRPQPFVTLEDLFGEPKPDLR